MCRKTAHKYRRDLVHEADNNNNNNNTASSNAASWRSWCLIETLRRTLFVAHAINVLAARLRPQAAYFYEALDDALLLDLPLPAPAPLWEAGDAGAWRAARQRLPTGWLRMTGRIMMTTIRQRKQQNTAWLVAAGGADDTFVRIVLATLFF